MPATQSFNPDHYQPYLDRLRRLYEKMDATYNGRAAQYGFSCHDCPDNCCRTRFYNHTRAEYYFLSAGLKKLDPEERRRVEERAAACCRQVAAADQAGQTPREMCPLNSDGRCGLHEHRLMICRLHGIPYEFSPPGRERFYGEGCAVFSRRHGRQPYLTFDRTPFYGELAALEQDFRRAAGFSGKFKMTIAQMVVQAGRGEVT